MQKLLFSVMITAMIVGFSNEKAYASNPVLGGLELNRITYADGNQWFTNQGWVSPGSCGSQCTRAYGVFDYRAGIDIDVVFAEFVMPASTGRIVSRDGYYFNTAGNVWQNCPTYYSWDSARQLRWYTVNTVVSNDCGDPEPDWDYRLKFVFDPSQVGGGDFRYILGYYWD